MRSRNEEWTRRTVFVGLLMASLALTAGLPLAAQAPPQTDPWDPHRILYNGKVELLAGYYPGLQALVVSPQVDPANPAAATYYKKLIDTLTDQAHGNYTNLLRVVLTMGMALEDRPWLHPYQRSGTPNCHLATARHRCTNHALALGITRNRFDLNKFNQPFFDYWDAVIGYAKGKGLIVQVALFDGAHLGDWNKYRSPSQYPEWPPFEYIGQAYDYFEGGNNINSVRISTPTDWHTNSGAVNRQKAFVAKAVEELGHHHNIIWEIMNEFQEGKVNPGVRDRPSPADPTGHPWFGQMRQQIRDTEWANGYAQHMIMPYDSPDHLEVSGHRTPGRNDSDNDYKNVHLGLVANFDTFPSPIIADNDCCANPGTPEQLRRKAWTSLVSGANPSMLVYNVTGSTSPTGLGLYSNGTPNPNHSTQQGIRWTGYTRKLIKDRNIDLRGMNPRDDLLSSASQPGFVWCLASAAVNDERSIVYFYKPGSVTVSGLAPDWEYWWLNPISGAYTWGMGSGTTSTFSTPAGNHDWVLYVARTVETKSTGVADAYVAEESPDTNFGKSSQLQVRYAPADYGRFSFLKFSIPSFSGSVVSAKLRVRTQDRSIPSVAAYKMHNMSWSETSINWNNWDRNGAVTFTYLSTTGTLAANTWHDIDVTSAVQGWGTLNLGLATGTDIEGLDFWSRESSYRPQLRIQRSTSSTPLVVNPVADAWVSENSPSTNYGRRTDLRVRVDPSHYGKYSFLRFVVPSYPGTLLSAKLRLRTMWTPVASAAFYKMNNMGNWSETSIDWKNWDRMGAVTFTYLRSIGPLVANAWYEVDVTSAVSGPGTVLNLGIASGHDQGNQKFWARESGSYKPELVITSRP